MARVDPQDDDVRRFVVWHFRYDPDRCQRRNVEVAAFDNEAEYRAFMTSYGAELDERKLSGEAEAREHLGGVVLEPGHKRRQQNGRKLTKAFKDAARTGIPLSEDELDALCADLPSNVGVLRASRT